MSICQTLKVKPTTIECNSYKILRLLLIPLPYEMSTTSQNDRHDPKLCVAGVSTIGEPGTVFGAPELPVAGPAGGTD